jgi:hypothetical protein
MTIIYYKIIENKFISNNVILVPVDKGRTIVAVDNTVYVINSQHS